MFSEINKKENQKPPPIMTNGKIEIIILITKYSITPNTPSELVSLFLAEKNRLFFGNKAFSVKGMLTDGDGGGVGVDVDGVLLLCSIKLSIVSILALYVDILSYNSDSRSNVILCNERNW